MGAHRLQHSTSCTEQDVEISEVERELLRACSLLGDGAHFEFTLFEGVQQLSWTAAAIDSCSGTLRAAAIHVEATSRIRTSTRNVITANKTQRATKRCLDGGGHVATKQYGLADTR
jgi:hypothetical protein